VNKVIAVCGDSWFSADPDFPGKSFGELVCAKNNWELLSLARGGCSNFTIALQVDKAIERQADFVILGTTTPDRGEFPIINAQNISIWNKLKSSFTWKNWFTTQPEVYVKARGISNMLHTNSLSSTHNWISNPTIVSESFNNLVFHDHKKLTPEQIVNKFKDSTVIVFDVETTGIDPKLQYTIVTEIAAVAIEANTGKTLGQYHKKALLTKEVLKQIKKQSFFQPLSSISSFMFCYTHG
jgi:hypothetical protein